MTDTTKKTNGQKGEEEKEQEQSHPARQEESTTSELDKLREQLEAKEEEAKANHDRFLRQAAELENFKKRILREKEEATRYANETLIRDLLPVLDNLERAVEHAKGGGNGKPLVEGVDMVLKGFLDVLNKHGVTQVSAVGERFDPERHEAMAQVESDSHEPNTVVEEYHKGYLLLDRLLRPSLVSVAKPSESKEKKKENDEVENDQGDD